MDMIFVQEEVSKHICRKLYRWFVYYEIDSAAEENVIKPLATIFRANNYEIKPVLKALFSSEHFFDQVNRSCVIKSPTDHLIGFFRTTDSWSWNPLAYRPWFPALPLVPFKRSCSPRGFNTLEPTLSLPLDSPC